MKLFFWLACLSMAIPGKSQNNPRSILITNVQIFNGKDEKTVSGYVLLTGNLIREVAAGAMAPSKMANLTVIDGQGKFLMPGLIDAHVHTLMESMPLNLAMVSDIGYLNLRGAYAVEKELLRGFTTVRDVGGASFSLKKAIDEGLTSGPRIFPSGATISQTGGHGDFRYPTDVPEQIGAPLSYMERTGMTALADGADQVLLRTREQFRLGASQIKLMAGGGVASDYDPLDVTQFTEAEIHAAVEAADNWGTYVTVHAYTPKAIQTAIRAGVKCIEHGQLADEQTARIMQEKGIWWCLQPFLDDQESFFAEGSANRKKQLEMFAGTDSAYHLAKKYHVRTAWGSDILFSEKHAAQQGADLAKLIRWYTPFEILRMATSENAALLELSGKRNPYSDGKLGVVEPGAYADLILVDGNPLQNIQLVADPDKNFLVILKNGVIYKNALKSKTSK